MSLPYMPLYIADYLADTRRLSTLEHGAYMLLIMEYWRNGGLPDDDRKLARIVGLQESEWQEIRNDIAEMFHDGWKHKRIDAELARSGVKHSSAVANGRQGGAAKWGGLTAINKAKRSERLANARSIARHTKDQWQAMLEFCGFSCVACGSRDDIVKDHIKPIYAGGSDGIENLQPMCRRCNASKGPDDADLRPNGWQNACITPSERLANACQSEPDINSNSSLRSELPKKTREAKGTRLPEGWTPSAGQKTDAIELERFRDYWTAKAGAGARKADWDATWRNWLRTAAERKQPARAGPAPPRDAVTDLLANHLRGQTREPDHRPIIEINPVDPGAPKPGGGTGFGDPVQRDDPWQSPALRELVTTAYRRA